MGNGSGQDSTRNQAQASKQSTTSPPGKHTTKRRGPLHLKGLQSLERLRDRVKAAARELERLRKENAALAERIRALEARPAVDLEGTVLAFDEDPDALREQIEGFIEAIDTYLAGKSR